MDNEEDLSDIEFNDSDDGEMLDDELISGLNKKLMKNSKSKGKKKGRGIDSDIFMSAEKFAEMLEEQSKGKQGGSNTFNSSDGASVKQIDWETKRHQRLKGSFSKNKRKAAQFNNKQAKKSKR